MSDDIQRLNDIRERHEAANAEVVRMSNPVIDDALNDIPWLLDQLTEAHRLNDEALLVLQDRDARNQQTAELEQWRQQLYTDLGIDPGTDPVEVARHVQALIATVATVQDCNEDLRDERAMNEDALRQDEAKLTAAQNLIDQWQRKANAQFWGYRNMAVSDAYDACAVELGAALDSQPAPSANSQDAPSSSKDLEQPDPDDYVPPVYVGPESLKAAAEGFAGPLRDPTLTGGIVPPGTYFVVGEQDGDQP